MKNPAKAEPNQDTLLVQAKTQRAARFQQIKQVTAKLGSVAPSSFQAVGENLKKKGLY
jgi:hypothetical protein